MAETTVRPDKVNFKLSLAFHLSSFCLFYVCRPIHLAILFVEAFSPVSW